MQYRRAEDDGSIRYGDLKQDLSKALTEHFSEFREKRKELLEHKEKIAEILIEGAHDAKSIASNTLEDVRKMVGIR